MKITPRDVVTFQTIYKYRTGKSMKSEKAYERLQKLVQQMDLIYKEIKVDDIKSLEKPLTIEIEIDEPRTEIDI